MYLITSINNIMIFYFTCDRWENQESIPPFTIIQEFNSSDDSSSFWRSEFSGIFWKVLCVWMLTCMYVGLPLACLMPPAPPAGYWVSWTWSYRGMKASVWVLEVALSPLKEAEQCVISTLSHYSNPYFYTLAPL